MKSIINDALNVVVLYTISSEVVRGQIIIIYKVLERLSF